MGNRPTGVPVFCQWARKKYGLDGARLYIQMDLIESDDQLRTRMVHDHFAVWAEFMAHHAAEKMGVLK